MVDKTTKNLINLYMEYSDRKTLTVDEFILFRKEAVKECKHMSVEITKQDKRENADTPLSVSVNKNVVSENAQNSEASYDNHIIQNDVGFSDENFLNMMKQIED